MTAEPIQPLSAVRSRRCPARRGSALLYTSLIIVTLMMCVGVLSLDGGKMIYSRATLADAIDASARAGASALADGNDARAAVLEILRRNVPADVQLDESKVMVATGRWDAARHVFAAGGTPTNSVRVQTQQRYGGSVFQQLAGAGIKNFNVTAIAAFQQRDIMLVLDYSGSMNNQAKVDALRDAVDTFIDTVHSVSNGRDQVGLVSYSDYATLDQPLAKGSLVMQAIKDLARAKPADGATNIGGGLSTALDELALRGRPGAAKVVLLLTDGLANRPTDRDPLQYARDGAARAALAGVTIYAISFGSDADQTLMQQVAAATDGSFNHVASGWSQTAELDAVFREVARSQTAHLVK